MSKAITARRAAGCAALLLFCGAHVAPVQALELNDFNVVFPIIRDGAKKGEHPSHQVVQAVAGNLVIRASDEGCEWNRAMSLIYKPGAFSGSAECPTARKGTTITYREKGARATYDTKMTVAGNVVTLEGRMNVNAIESYMYCRTRFWKKEKNEVIVQTLKMRIVGSTCQILQHVTTRTKTERYLESDSHRTPDPMSIETYRAPAGAKCRLIIRSQQPIGPPLTPPGDAEGLCG